MIKRQQKRQLYECICENCSQVFLSPDEEMVLCKICWEGYINNQLRANFKVTLTKEIIDKILLEKDNKKEKENANR